MNGPAVTIVDFPETRVAMLRHRGDPALVDASVLRFIAWRRQVGLPPARSATFTVFHDDPATTPPDQYRLDLCAATDAPVAANPDGVVAGILPAGRCAMLRHVGAGTLAEPALALCRDWLAASGETRRDFPLFCRRVAFPPDVAADAAVTELYLPLK